MPTFCGNMHSTFRCSGVNLFRTHPSNRETVPKDLLHWMDAATHTTCKPPHAPKSPKKSKAANPPRSKTFQDRASASHSAFCAENNYRDYCFVAAMNRQAIDPSQAIFLFLTMSGHVIREKAIKTHSEHRMAQQRIRVPN